jgi:septal ring factor EnvC (AmiA/AmiB activator)
LGCVDGHGLEVALTDARARTDAAKVQADSALATSREFLANLLAAREEQRRQLDENGVAFTDLRRELEDVRRNSASLRGAIEELRKAQADSAAQARIYYIDLDSRVRQMKQPASQPAAEPRNSASQ